MKRAIIHIATSFQRQNSLASNYRSGCMIQQPRFILLAPKNQCGHLGSGETEMEWQTKIGDCFEDPMFVFAGNSTTETNAFELLSQLREDDITWKETAIHFAQYLLHKGCNAQQVDEQIFRIQQRYFFWLK